MTSVIDLIDEDRLFNSLPLFHSFGLTIGTLLPLIRGIYTFLYPSPAPLPRRPSRRLRSRLHDHARHKHLPQRLRAQGPPLRFSQPAPLFAGAEKLQDATAQTWARRFGVRILEGYGATECSPCISVNTPMQPCYGSAGRFLPGIEHAGGRRRRQRGRPVVRPRTERDAGLSQCRRRTPNSELGGW